MLKMLNKIIVSYVRTIAWQYARTGKNIRKHYPLHTLIRSQSFLRTDLDIKVMLIGIES